MKFQRKLFIYTVIQRMTIKTLVSGFAREEEYNNKLQIYNTIIL